jgi:hypothetical protein
MTYRYPGGLIRRTAANTAITGASGVWDLGSQAQAVRNNTWPISGLANPVSGSLRFRASNSAYLSRTPTSSGNRRTWTWSAWVKLGTIAASNGTLFSAGTTSGGSTRFYLRYTGSQFQTGYGSFNLDTTVAVFRDPSAWYHVVLAVDTTQATASNRVKIYVNGVQQAVTTDANYTLNDDTAVNNTVSHQIASDQIIPGGYFDGYMTEVYLIDGQALTPASFGQTSAITGVWEPIKYTGTYGTNGFYLSLSDTSSIGKDFSGNGNNWTPNNISTASGSTFDLMRDVPTQYTPQGATDIGGTVRGNYATWNSIFPGTPTLSNGNLDLTSATTSQVAVSTMAAILGDTQKYYFEYSYTSTPSVNGGGGVWDTNSVFTPGAGPDGGTGTRYLPAGVGGGNSGLIVKFVNGTSTSIGIYASYTTGDIIGVAFDCGAGTVSYYKNNTLQVTITDAAFVGKAFAPFVYVYAGNVSTNFGQRPFAYTPPAGFKSLCTTNLPTPTIGATVATAANKYFDATLYTGNGGTQTITNAGGFQPDFIWEKARSNAFSHMLYDAVRGVQKYLRTNVTSAEVTDSTTLTAFNSNGFTVGSGDNGNNSGTTSVAWQWNAGGSTVTNTAGSITTSVRASPTAGFSIVTYSGNGTGGATIGHGLGVAPSMMIFKPRNAVGSWLVWHTGYNSNQAQMLLDSTAAIYNPGNGLYFNSTYPSSTVATLGTSSSVNDATYTYVAYMFAPVAGFSAFGSYTGNGSSNGPFIYTGFRPRFVMVKTTSNAGYNWNTHDAARNPSNSANLVLYPNTAAGDDAYGAGSGLDILSNGFKPRDTGGGLNGSGFTYIYMAFAEHPFKNSLAR